VWRFPNGTLFDESTSSEEFVLEGGKLRRLSSNQALGTRYRTVEAVLVSSAVRSLYPAGSAIGFRDGSLLRSDDDYWVISDGKRRPATTQTLQALGYDFGAVINTTTVALAPHAVGTQLTVAGGYPNGAALHASDVREAWMLGGTARPFITRTVRNSYRIRDVDLVGPADEAIEAGLSAPPVRFRDGSLIKAAAAPAVYLISDGQRRHISSGRTFTKMRYQWSNVRVVTEAELALHPEGSPL
jgi:hypothetical protein